MTGDLFTNPGFLVAVGLPLSGIVMLISARISREKRHKLIKSLLAILERPEKNLADIAIVKSMAHASLSKRGWAMVPFAPFMVLGFTLFLVYAYLFKGSSFTADFFAKVDSKSLETEVAHQTGLNATTATIWGTSELKESWKLARDVMQYQTPLSHAWMLICALPLLLLLAITVLFLGHGTERVRSVSKSVLGRFSLIEHVLKA